MKIIELSLNCKAREFLYFKLYGKQCITPVAIMTSSAKNNHERITSLCERLGWFGRGRSLFHFFEQVRYKKFQWQIGLLLLPVSPSLNYVELWMHLCVCNLVWTCSLLFRLLVQKMANGWSLVNSCPFASLVVMVWYGSLHMIRAFSNGFMITEEKVQQLDK